MDKLQDENIVCLAGADWDNPLWTNRQHIMSRLSHQNRILYVESFGLRPPSVNTKDLSRVLVKLRYIWRNLRKINDRLFIYTPLLVPFYKFESIKRFNHLILLHSLRKISKKLEFQQPILWSYVPNAIDLVGQLGEKLIVYHCVDELSATPGFPRDTIRVMERQFLRKADVVITTSKGLYEDKRKLNPNTYYQPNVADAVHFMKAMDESTPVPPDIARIPTPRIGYVGHLADHKVDLGLIQYVAKTHKEWSIVIIGPVWAGNKKDNQNIETLGNEPNVYLLGFKPYEVLPCYLKAFDVCMLPHKLTEYSVRSFPLKFNEFMATGRPIVSSGLPALEEYADMIWMARNRHDFVRGINYYLNSDNEAMKAKRVEIACQNTWEHRIKSISRIVEEALRQKSYKPSISK